MEVVAILWIIGMCYTMGLVAGVALEDRPVGAEWLLFIGILIFCIPFWPVFLGLKDS